MEYTRVHRLLRIITLVNGSSRLNAARLAEACGTTERNVYRDLKMIEAAGVPISYDREAGGYLIQRDFFLRPADFTLEEAMALVLLAKEVGQREQLPHVGQAAKAIDKLLATLPLKIRDMIDGLMPCMSVDLARASYEPTAELYTRIRQAITDRRALECRYESPIRHSSASAGSDSGSFRFDPYALYFGQRSWYVIGRHHGHREVRTLKLARMTDCRSIDKPYFIPDDFSLEKHFGAAWRMMPAGKLYDIMLRFDATVAETVADTHWHSSQEFNWHEDGSIDMYFRVDGLEEIVWWILGYGPHCKVVKPRVLRQKVANLLATAAAHYRSTKAFRAKHPSSYGECAVCEDRNGSPRKRRRVSLT